MEQDDYIDELINSFNDGDTDVVEYFSGYQNFFEFLKRRDRFDELNPKTGADSYKWVNEYLLFLYSNNKEKFYHWCKEFLGDIEIENGKVYLFADAEDLATLFCDSRDYSRDSIEKILSGDYDHNWYSGWYDIDIYDNVIDELNEKNLKTLKQVFINDLQGKEISPETSELELIAAEEGTGEHVIVTEKNIDRIFKDKETINHLLDEELEDTKENLKTIYHNAEESALYDGYYDEVWGELNEFFDGKPEWVSKQRGGYYKEGKWTPKFVDFTKLEISDFDTLVVDYLEANKNYNDGTLEEMGYFLKILSEEKDCLRVRFPDYADFRKIQKNINEMFGDYI